MKNYQVFQVVGDGRIFKGEFEDIEDATTFANLLTKSEPNWQVAVTLVRVIVSAKTNESQRDCAI